MINKITENKKQAHFFENDLKQHELLIINKLKKLSNLQSNAPLNNTDIKLETIIIKKEKSSFLLDEKDLYNKKNTSFRGSKKEDFLLKKNKEKWLNYFFSSNPLNLLFSIDQFLIEFAKKQSQRRKSSEYQEQLKHRKKLTLFYGHLSKKQLQSLINQSLSYQGYFSKNFFSLVERRLDVVLYRTGLVTNIITARQLISHKKILVNNKILNIPSYQVNPGDIISIKKKTKNEIIFPLLETVKKNLRKRNSRFLLSQNFLSKLKNRKNYKKKNTLKIFISFLLKKIEKRAHLKIKNSWFHLLENRTDHTLNKKSFSVERRREFSFERRREFFTLLKFKSLISRQAQSFFLKCLQKNFLFVDRKPFFQKNSTRFINLLEHNVFSTKKTNPQKGDFFSNTSSQKKDSLEKNTKMVMKNKPASFLLLKKENALYRNIAYKTLVQIHSFFFCFTQKNHSLGSNELIFFLSNKIQSWKKENIIQYNTNFQKNNLLTLKLNKHYKRKRSRNQIGKALRFCMIKPMHIEVSYRMSTAIFLYSPQRLTFPFYIDVDLVLRSFR